METFAILEKGKWKIISHRNPRPHAHACMPPYAVAEMFSKVPETWDLLTL
jgi:hypothetical protein